jgi:hypothetical protein
MDGNLPDAAMHRREIPSVDSATSIRISTSDNPRAITLARLAATAKLSPCP